MTALPACRLFLVTPPIADPAALREPLAAALAAGDVGCVLVRFAAADEAAIVAAGKLLLPVIQGRDVAAILDGRPELAARAGFDGAHIAFDGDFPGARKSLGTERICGIDCGTSRHIGIETADGGADYVGFSNAGPPQEESVIELVRWWSEMMTVPCVAIGAASPAECEAFAAAGADFVALAVAVWSHSAGPAAAIKEFNEAIARGLRVRTPG